MELIEKNWPSDPVYPNYEKYFSKHDLKYPLPLGFDIEGYYCAGAVRKEDLIDNTFYIGICRNAVTAKWDANENVFWYLRSKFYIKFFEHINHFSDDDWYDLFIPMKVKSFFEDWWEKEQERFHCRHFDTKEIAHSAWLAGKTYAL